MLTTNIPTIAQGFLYDELIMHSQFQWQCFHMDAKGNFYVYVFMQN